MFLKKGRYFRPYQVHPDLHHSVDSPTTKELRDWSLITGRGGLQNGRGGHVKFYSYEKGGREKF